MPVAFSAAFSAAALVSTRRSRSQEHTSNRFHRVLVMLVVGVVPLWTVSLLHEQSIDDHRHTHMPELLVKKSTILNVDVALSPMLPSPYVHSVYLGLG